MKIYQEVKRIELVEVEVGDPDAILMMSMESYRKYHSKTVCCICNKKIKDDSIAGLIFSGRNGMVNQISHKTCANTNCPNVRII